MLARPVTAGRGSVGPAGRTGTASAAPPCRTFPGRRCRSIPRCASASDPGVLDAHGPTTPTPNAPSNWPGAHRVGFPATSYQRRYPHQLSGGRQQRVGIAMAFACRPRGRPRRPTTGLDVMTRHWSCDHRAPDPGTTSRPSHHSRPRRGVHRGRRSPSCAGRSSRATVDGCCVPSPVHHRLIGASPTSADACRKARPRSGAVGPGVGVLWRQHRVAGRGSGCARRLPHAAR